MCHKFLVLPVKKLLKSVHIYGSYRKNKTGVPFFGTPGSRRKPIVAETIVAVPDNYSRPKRRQFVAVFGDYTTIVANVNEAF